MNEKRKKRSFWSRWLPHVLFWCTLLSLMGSLVFLGRAALFSLSLFIVLFPITLIVMLVRWWPSRPCQSLPNSRRWKRRLNFVSAGVLVAAAINVFAGLNFFGTPLGTTLLVAGTLLLPAAMVAALVSFSLSRDEVTEDLLEPDEDILFRADTHWAIFLPPIQLLTLCILLVLGPFGLGGEVVAAVVYVVIVPGVMARALAIFLNTEVSVTDRRLITVTGTLFRRKRTLELDHIRAAGLSQGRLGRLLGYGKVGIIGRDGGSIKLPGIADPMSLRDMLDPTHTTAPSI
ncbi:MULTISPECIES: PH domain-containing protein [Ectothiorhodospira]|uniref:PH domain-containing protein n=1 Tax=Ectothiorhodospira TaxID=1051 RepID=UPI001EE94BE4|nr:MULTISPECIES: PH domain-containing protein [Ectothiorhodospira]MCG5493895.1 PH domain-containing protein [Ectothiorhodospira variabilis]MCG5498109.1 PH domain-containing protein [Ectothiorhodospira variabilis]MCG5503698.1 PH domain-containing protein [Ectothiorhodospira variabilis]MCG5506854.1 PH domain-containing protein [Ectothiorhodospira variabilis]MCG5524698.1 PH domain-containing protein [Ectothiorhodospira haloalkaliphila]